MMEKKMLKDVNILSDTHSNIAVLELDNCDEASIKAAKEKVEVLVGNQGLNVLINNAAILIRDQSIEVVTIENLMEHFSVNTVGTIMVCKAFLPLIRKASKAFSHLSMSTERAAIVNIGSRFASIQDNASGRSYASRLSKCGVNMLTKSLSLELKPDKILSVCLHPGWVKTEMGGPDALISLEESVDGLINVVSGVTEENNGLFYRYDGGLIPW